VRGVDSVDKTALVQFAHDSRFYKRLHPNLTDFWRPHFHQVLRVAQSLDGRKGLLFDGAQQVLVAFFRRILIGFEAAHNRFNDDRLVFWIKAKGDALDHRLEKVFGNFGPLLQQSAGDHGRLIDHRFLKVAVFSQNREAFLTQSPAKDAVKRCGVHGLVFHCLTLDGLIADREHGDLIALRLEAELFEPEHGAHPRTAADARDAYLFAAQIFRSFNRGPRQEVIGIASGKTIDDLDIMTGAGSGQSGATASRADVNVARTQSCDQLSCAAQKDGLRLQAIFIEEPLFFSQPKRRETSVHLPRSRRRMFPLLPRGPR